MIYDPDIIGAEGKRVFYIKHTPGKGVCIIFTDMTALLVVPDRTGVRVKMFHSEECKRRDRV